MLNSDKIMIESVGGRVIGAMSGPALMRVSNCAFCGLWWLRATILLAMAVAAISFRMLLDGK